MHAATIPEWLTAAAIGTSAFVPGALLILGLDHDLHPGRTAAARSIAARARTTVAVATLIAAIHINPTTVGSR